MVSAAAAAAAPAGVRVGDGEPLAHLRLDEVDGRTLERAYGTPVDQELHARVLVDLIVLAVGIVEPHAVVDGAAAALVTDEYPDPDLQSSCCSMIPFSWTAASSVTVNKVISFRDKPADDRSSL